MEDVGNIHVNIYLYIYIWGSITLRLPMREAIPKVSDQFELELYNILQYYTERY